MTWREIKVAVEQAGISDEEEISAIQCENGDGDHTFQTMRLGKSLKLSENASVDKVRRDSEGCAS